MLAPISLPEGATVDDEGLWVQTLHRPRDSQVRGALFLDRDGVIVEEVGHLRHADDVHLVPGAATAIGAANGRGVPVVIVTNQSGIGRGLFGWSDFILVQDAMLRALAMGGAFVDGVLACPHHPKGRPPYDHPDHPARKPNPGMLIRAAALLPIDLTRSWIVGDRARDIGAGFNAGLAGGVHVATGHGSAPDERPAALAFSRDEKFRVLAEPSLASAPAILPLF